MNRLRRHIWGAAGVGARSTLRETPYRPARECMNHPEQPQTHTYFAFPSMCHTEEARRWTKERSKGRIAEQMCQLMRNTTQIDFCRNTMKPHTQETTASPLIGHSGHFSQKWTGHEKRELLTVDKVFIWSAQALTPPWPLEDSKAFWVLWFSCRIPVGTDRSVRLPSPTGAAAPRGEVMSG